MAILYNAKLNLKARNVQAGISHNNHFTDISLLFTFEDKVCVFTSHLYKLRLDNLQIFRATTICRLYRQHHLKPTGIQILSETSFINKNLSVHVFPSNSKIC